MITITPDWDLFLWIFWILLIVSSISKMILGAIGKEKDTHWTLLDVLDGFLGLVIAAVVVVL